MECENVQIVGLWGRVFAKDLFKCGRMLREHILGSDVKFLCAPVIHLRKKRRRNSSPKLPHQISASGIIPELKTPVRVQSPPGAHLFTSRLQRWTVWPGHGRYQCQRSRGMSEVPFWPRHDTSLESDQFSRSGAESVGSSKTFQPWKPSIKSSKWLKLYGWTWLICRTLREWFCLSLIRHLYNPTRVSTKKNKASLHHGRHEVGCVCFADPTLQPWVMDSSSLLLCIGAASSRSIARVRFLNRVKKAWWKQIQINSRFRIGMQRSFEADWKQLKSFKHFQNWNTDLRINPTPESLFRGWGYWQRCTWTNTLNRQTSESWTAQWKGGVFCWVNFVILKFD